MSHRRLGAVFERFSRALKSKPTFGPFLFKYPFSNRKEIDAHSLQNVSNFHFWCLMGRGVLIESTITGPTKFV